MRNNQPKRQEHQGKPKAVTLRERVQKAVNRIPLANFGNVRVKYTDEREMECSMRAFSPADACRLIDGLRARASPPTAIPATTRRSWHPNKE